MSNDMPRMVRHYLFSGGLDGRVFVSSGSSSPYVITRPPVRDYANQIPVQFVSIGSHASTVADLTEMLDDIEYDPKNLPTNPKNDQILDEEFLRKVRLRGVGD